MNTPITTSISTVSARISAKWPFDARHYPALAGKNEVAVRRFSFLHMTLHLAKEAGTLARIEERAQHRSGEALPPREWRRIRKLAMKCIVSGFRLFVIAGGTAEQLERYINRTT